jgi:hypothetical protein
MGRPCSGPQPFRQLQDGGQGTQRIPQCCGKADWCRFSRTRPPGSCDSLGPPPVRTTQDAGRLLCAPLAEVALGGGKRGVSWSGAHEGALAGGEDLGVVLGAGVEEHRRINFKPAISPASRATHALRPGRDEERSGKGPLGPMPDVIFHSPAGRPPWPGRYTRDLARPSWATLQHGKRLVWDKGALDRYRDGQVQGSVAGPDHDPIMADIHAAKSPEVRPAGHS